MERCKTSVKLNPLFKRISIFVYVILSCRFILYHGDAKDLDKYKDESFDGVLMTSNYFEKSIN